LTLLNYVSLKGNKLRILPPKNVREVCEDYDYRYFLEELIEENQQLNEEIEHLKYQPGGVGYQEAKEDFESHI